MTLLDLMGEGFTVERPLGWVTLLLGLLAIVLGTRALTELSSLVPPPRSWRTFVVTLLLGVAAAGGAWWTLQLP